MLPLIFLVVGVLAQQTFAEEPEAIVGGKAALPGQFPYQVSMRRYGSHFCGGSIIAPTKILTAAHCVDGKSASDIQIATGTTSSTEGQLHKVAKIVMHSKYTPTRETAWNNDVAVVTLAAPIQYNQNQSSIALADSTPAGGQACTLSGWGLTSLNGQIPRDLQFMNQAVVPKSQCQQDHRGMPLTGSHLCTMNRYGIGACSGDSGGPLVSNGRQVGITSWVRLCAQGVPDVYSDVAYHRDFILGA